MDDYLDKFGFTPEEFGLKPAAAPAKAPAKAPAAPQKPAERPRNNFCDTPLRDLPLAMAYVPWQRFEKTYDLNEALDVGTIFPELDLPFLGYKGGMRR